MQKRTKLLKQAVPALLSVLLAVGAVPLTAFAQETVYSNPEIIAVSDAETDDNTVMAAAAMDDENDAANENRGESAESTETRGGGKGNGSQGGGRDSQSGGKEESQESSGTVYSETAVSIPEALADGTYQGTATVNHDEDESFNAYPITVDVLVKDGAISSFTVTGASGQNTQYSKRAENGINAALSGKGAGTYQVDTVSTATCSSKAIIQAVNAAMTSHPYDTTIALSAAVYNPAGTTFTVTVKSPAEGVDYSDITLAYAMGKFATQMTKDTDYKVKELSKTDDEAVYQITVLPSGAYSIDDEDLVWAGSYNKLGQNIDVTVAGTTVGRVTLNSSATAKIRNNILSVSGGNGESLADYISGITNVTLTYENSEGEAVTDSYTTQWQHDVEPEYTGADFFHEDGSINFEIAPFVNGAQGTYTITVSSAGFASITESVGLGISDGTYDASGYVANYDYELALKVTVSEGKVTAIENATTDYGQAANKNKSYTEKAVEGINNALAANPEDDVDSIDVISGATLSSNAVKQAIAGVLGQSFDLDKANEATNQGSSHKGEGSTEEEGKSERPQSSAPDGYVTYTVTLNAEGQPVIRFTAHPDDGDTVSMSMLLVVDDTGKKMIRVSEPEDVEGYFTYNPETEEFTITNDALESVEAIFTSETYGRIHFDVDLTNITDETAADSGKENTETAQKENAAGASSAGQNTVKTGDSSAMALWAWVLLAASAATACFTIVPRKGKNSRN